MYFVKSMRTADRFMKSRKGSGKQQHTKAKGIEQ